MFTYTCIFEVHESCLRLSISVTRATKRGQSVCELRVRLCCKRVSASTSPCLQSQLLLIFYPRHVTANSSASIVLAGCASVFVIWSLLVSTNFAIMTMPLSMGKFCTQTATNWHGTAYLNTFVYFLPLPSDKGNEAGPACVLAATD